MEDVWLPRLGILMLGITGISAAIGCSIILASGHQVPCELSNIGVGAASTLGAVIMALTSRKDGYHDERR